MLPDPGNQGYLLEQLEQNNQLADTDLMKDNGFQFHRQFEHANVNTNQQLLNQNDGNDGVICLDNHRQQQMQVHHQPPLP